MTILILMIMLIWIIGKNKKNDLYRGIFIVYILIFESFWEQLLNIS